MTRKAKMEEVTKSILKAELIKMARMATMAKRQKWS